MPAASASSCAWHDRSMVTYHHTASSTEWPTVSRPWLRRMTALRSSSTTPDALALRLVEHHAGEVVEQRVVVVERARVLRERVEQTTERRPRLAVQRVRVRGGDDVGPRLVQRRVDGERRGVHAALALDDLALRVDEEQVGHADVAERHPERVHPEVVEPLGVTGGDVTGDALLEPELAEDAEAGGEALLAVLALLLDGVVLREVPALVADGGRLGQVGHGVTSCVRMLSPRVDHGRDQGPKIRDGSE